MRNKKTCFLLITIIFLVILNFFPKPKEVLKEEEKSTKTEKLISMNLEQTAGAGDYKTVTQSSWPTEGYVFNSELSKCENGSELSWDDTKKTVIVLGNISDKCYIYFDIYMPTLAEYVISQYGNVQGNNNIYFHNGTITSDDGTIIDANDNSYRYAGTNDEVKNYICFGSDNETCPENNLYRIIGVFNNHVKLIKATAGNADILGTDGAYETDTTYKWSILTSCPSGVALNYNNLTFLANKNIIAAPTPITTTGFFDWKYSELNTINLNTNFINQLSSKWQSLIINTDWVVKWNAYSDIFWYFNASEAFTNEILNTNENNLYNAKIGMMYVSDYAYSASKERWADNISASKFPWMFVGEEWTMLSVSDGGKIYIDDGSSFSRADSTNVAKISRPVFYLNQNILYDKGTGTSDNPIRLKF